MFGPDAHHHCHHEHLVSGVVEFAAVTLVMAGGALVQGCIGFGLGLFAVPFLVLIQPQFVPGPILFSSGLLTVMMLIRERHGIQRHDLAWSLSGRVIGTGLAMIVLVVVPSEQMKLIFGVMILLATALTTSGYHLQTTPHTLTGAGVLSGFMATTVSIGGPPMALLYSRREGPHLRATLSAYFVVGTVLSLVGLHFVGRFGLRELLLGLGLLPGMAIGFALSIKAVRFVDGKALRPTILAVCAITGTLVVIEALR
jgi:hypothetical protein